MELKKYTLDGFSTGSTSSAVPGLELSKWLTCNVLSFKVTIRNSEG